MLNAVVCLQKTKESMLAKWTMRCSMATYIVAAVDCYVRNDLWHALYEFCNPILKVSPVLQLQKQR